ncbi:histidinol-phosphatase HisJ [Niallia nealsonii]|uniref:Histidinol-phosphatase n=1 Tax=Niallia nealsonii TaxID=115979 RepID=A0A2N0Z651_9BACI|nr:histidinol-phosphatase HisJ [Niallia nealsonii]PKG24970.1 histidinol phosphatase [Niallia nealsonii]
MKTATKKDGHIHTAFCPHGTKDAISDYIEQAILLGFTEISFTEHAPLPAGFIDSTPTKDSSIALEDLPHYVHMVEQAKDYYKNKIKINIGLEVDYIEGFEQEIKSFLNEWGPKLDDSILSVHFLKNNMNYDCVDYSPELFANMISQYGSAEAIYERYFETIKKSVFADLGPFKPKRIGHITLVHKFQKKFPVSKDYRSTIIQLLKDIKQQQLELDYNGAGLYKPFCQESYPPSWVALEAKKQQISLVYGSDAHQAKDIGQGFDMLLGNR